MELKVLLTTSGHAKTGQWFELPSLEFEHRLRWLEEKGIEPLVMDIMGDVSFDILKDYKVSELNKIAEALEGLPEDVIDDLGLYLNYESLEELLESNGEHFIYHEFSTMRDVAKEMVLTGSIERLILPFDLMNDYLDYDSIARDIQTLHPFFQLSDGEYVEYAK
jgi:hypothetical protein